MKTYLRIALELTHDHPIPFPVQAQNTITRNLKRLGFVVPSAASKSQVAGVSAVAIQFADPPEGA